jgi:hypothetical protein
LSFFNSPLSSKKLKLGHRNAQVVAGRHFNAGVKYASQCVINAIAVCRCIVIVAAFVGEPSDTIRGEWTGQTKRSDCGSWQH